MAAMTICAWVLATPKQRARWRPKRRFIVPRHCSTHRAKALFDAEPSFGNLLVEAFLPLKRFVFDVNRFGIHMA